MASRRNKHSDDAAPAGQLPLFDPALGRLNLAYQHVEELRVDSAIRELGEYLEVFPTDTEVTNVLSSLQWLARHRPEEHEPTEDELFKWWRKIEREAERYELLDNNLYRRLKRGILAKIIKKMVKQGKKKLNGVHVGILYFEAEQYAEAIRELRLAAGAQPDESTIIGPLAEAEYRMGYKARAAVSYAIALLYDPLKCGFKSFSHPQIAAVQKKLEDIGLCFELARENLLAQCWLDAVLALAPQPSAVSLHELMARARELEPDARGHGRLVLLEDARLFRWCLQAAEWIRASPESHENEYEWCLARMRERDNRAYQTYLERVRLEELQGEDTVQFYSRPK